MPKVKEKLQRQAPKRVMGEKEREDLVDQIESERAFQSGLGRSLPDDGTIGALREADDLGVDPAKIDRRIGRVARALASGAPIELKGRARAEALARYKALETSLPEVLMTQYEQDLFPRHGHEYHAAVRKASKFEVGNPTTQKQIKEFRNLGRSLFPEDPDKSSIERLRKKR